MNQTETVIGAGLKIVCAREELAQKLSVVARGVSTRTAVQILSGILLRTAGGRVELAAAYFPHTGRIFTRFSEKKGSKELVELLKRIRSEYPEGKLYVILDNHKMHKSKELKAHLAVDRGIELVYTPTTSSWINAVEQVFASIQKWVLNNSSFQSVEEVTGMIERHLTSLGERLVDLLAVKPFTFALKMMVQVINPRPS